jgi:hypothetical protein
MMKRTATIVVFSVFATAGLAAAELADHACHRTSKNARKACRNGAEGDYWNAVGMCNNVANDAARSQCKSDASDTWTDAKQECGDQFDARESLCESLGQAPYDPAIVPANFLTPEQTAASPNPFFPLVPGTKWVYESDSERNTVTVTSSTREILGVVAIEVHDVVADKDSGETTEDTLDWFAEDVDGNVWYLGENSKELEDGLVVSLEGSWTAGVDGAKPGIVMKATPAVGDAYRQEFLLQTAEDAAAVESTTASATTPAASCDHDCLLTQDSTPLEPDVVERKFYKRGVGMILETDGGERSELVSFSR